MSNTRRNTRYQKSHIVLFFVLMSIIVNGQETNKNEFLDRVFFGGGLGGSFGTFTYFSVNPIVGYRITDRWQAGITAGYQYFSNGNTGFESSLYSGSVFSRYFVFRDVFLHAEAEALNGPWSLGERSTVGNYYVGGGYMARIGTNMGVAFTLLYNLNANSPIIGSNPSINIGFNYGI